MYVNCPPRSSSQLTCHGATSLLTGSQIALPAACLCICVHLERLASFTESSIFVTKQRRIIFDYLMCFALPVIYIALRKLPQFHGLKRGMLTPGFSDLLLQPRRFDLYEGFGCRPTTFGSVLPVLLFWAHPLLLAIAAVSYAGEGPSQTPLWYTNVVFRGSLVAFPGL